MTRVLHVNKAYAPHVGGVERVVQDIAEGLRDEFDTRVLVCNPGGPHVEERVAGVAVVRAAAPIVALSMPLSAQFFRLFRREARWADIVQFHHPFPLADAAALLDGCAGRRMFIWYHSDVVRQRAVMPLYGLILRRFLRRADRILVASNRLRDASSWLREVRDKCAVIPYGARPEEVTGPQEAFALPAEDFILFVGRLVPYKGAEVLIRAMPHVSIPLIVAGDGPLRESLEDLARRLNVAHRVHFLGKVSGARLRYLYARSRLFVLPSVMNNEAFALVQLEAMAHGKPVINTDLPTGVPEVSLHDVSGLTVPPRDPVALADAIQTIAGDPSRYDRYSRNALARAKELSMERFLDGMRRVYREGR
ncbi:MAG: glycosyltransferase [Planctomycetes bacterium]|nr:glycosyltransferase [Planctomycetota bacterium]